jgi:PAP_fibrillin.
MADRATLKAELEALGAATEAGFAEGGKRVERLAELAAALEALNPTPAPARQADLLRGRWRLVWSSFGLKREATLARLSFNLLPEEPVRVEALFQEVDPESGLYDNVVDYQRPDGTAGRAVTLGRFAPASDQRMDVVFTHAQASGHPRAGHRQRPHPAALVGCRLSRRGLPPEPRKLRQPLRAGACRTRARRLVAQRVKFDRRAALLGALALAAQARARGRAPWALAAPPPGPRAEDLLVEGVAIRLWHPGALAPEARAILFSHGANAEARRYDALLSGWAARRPSRRRRLAPRAAATGRGRRSG